jgi:DNA transformation protein
MPNKQEYLEFVMDWLSPVGEISARRMMGGHVLYCDGIVFALLSHNTFYLKVDELNRPRFEGLRLEPFRPFPDKPSAMQYYPPPAEFFEDPVTMADWARQSVAAGRRAQAKTKKPSRSAAHRTR